LPFRFAEIAKVILDVLVLLSVPFFLYALTNIISASDDLENPEKLRSLLKDLREARQAKSREGLKTLDHSELSLPNLCSMEVNEIRPYFLQAMSILTQLVRNPISGPTQGNA
jgi:GINS complex subunit 2